MRRRALDSLRSFSHFSHTSQPCQWARRRPIGSRRIQIAATPSSTSPPAETWDGNGTATSQPDARFEVLGAPSSLLSVALSASQPLYTRRGTLAAVSGKPENALSTLSLLSPLSRSLTGTPFLYQKLSSPTPLTALIAPRSPNTTFAVLYLDGRVDWVVAQRTGLAAWAGSALTVRPKLAAAALGLGFAHWGQTALTGRGLVALAGRGNVYQVTLKHGEEYVLHPSHVLAYSASGPAPAPYRFRSRAFALQVPALSAWVPFANSRFLREMQKTGTWRFLAAAAFRVRTWARRTIWGDRLFMRFQGPTTILLQSRGARLRDSLSERDVNEIADSPVGAVEQAVALESQKDVDTKQRVKAPASPPDRPTKMSFATVRSGKVEIRDAQL